MKYSLGTLLKVREHNKKTAEQQLIEAKFQLESEQKKLKDIKTHLENTIHTREILYDNFFVKAQHEPLRKQEVLMIAMLSQKNVTNQTAIKKSLSRQKEAVQSAEEKKQVATMGALEAYRDLKVIDKHLKIWQRNNKKIEELKAEYENDDQNGMRFWLRKQRG